MSIDENKEVVRRFYQAFEANDLDGLKEILAPDLVAYNPDAQNREEHLQGIAGWNSMFGNNRFEILEQVAEKEFVASRVILHCTHSQGAFQGIAPTGLMIEAPAVTFERIRDGKIVERRVFSNMERALQPLHAAATQAASKPSVGSIEAFVMTTEQNKELINRFLQASVDRDQSAFKEMIAPDFIAHLPGGPQNRDEFLRHNLGFALPFSNITFTIEDQVAEGDKVMVRAVWQGTHTGDFMGVPPSGKQIVIRAYLSERVRDGKVVEHWSMFDIMSMMQQLGLVPSPVG